MTNFDEILDRTGINSSKWAAVEKNHAIPMFVADMDFRSPKAITDTIAQRAENPTYGYTNLPPELIPAIVDHYKRKYDTVLDPEWIVITPSVLTASRIACSLSGGTIQYNVPMYSHIRVLHDETGLPYVETKLAVDENGRYVPDFAAMDKDCTPDVKTYILCNPHNPVGRVYTREELEKTVAFCKKHDLLLISDEIHCELILDDNRHIPLFSLNDEAKKNTITITSAGKICNIPGLPIAMAIIPDEKLRERFKTWSKGLFPVNNIFAGIAFLKNYDGSCEEWKKELCAYLSANRDYLCERVAKMDGISVTHNEGTYLGWIDCRALGLENPAGYFLENGVMYNDGEAFGDHQFVRINFGCPRSQLKEALDRTEAAIKKLGK